MKRGRAGSKCSKSLRADTKVVQKGKADGTLHYDGRNRLVRPGLKVGGAQAQAG